MRRSHLLLGVFLAVCCVATARSQESRVDTTLRVIQSLYESGSYVNSEIEARRLLDLPLLNDSVRVLAEKWIAFSLVAQGKSSEAKNHFIACLRIDPRFDLDPILTSPKITAVFNEAKSQMPADAVTRGNSSIGGGVSVSRGATYRAVIFPGWEQLHRGETTKGYLFLGGGIGTLGAGIVFEALRASAREEYLSAALPGDIESKYDRYNAYRKAEIVSLSAFAFLYVLSELDVFLLSDEGVPGTRPGLAPFSNSLLSFHIRF